MAWRWNSVIIIALFPGTPDKEKALAKYMAIVPFLADMGDHFRAHHKLGESAAYGLDMAPKLVEALGITEENTIAFMMVCFSQAEESPETMAAQCRDAFGPCGDHTETRGDNVIQFRPRGHTVH